MNKRTRTLLLVAVLLVVTVILTGCGAPQGQIDLNKPQGAWETLISFPLAKLLIALNGLIVSLGVPKLYSYGWAIIVFTILVKLVTFPLTLKQLQSTRATQELQPRLAELQQKYKQDRNKLAEEQMKLYKEAGVNPMGGCLPLLIQMPILFGLYQSLYILANPSVGELNNAHFLWIPDLSKPALTTGMGWIGTAWAARDYGTLLAYASLPLIMIVTQLLLQKMTQPAAVKRKEGQPADQTQMMGQMMMFMPIMFGYITLGLPAGLTLYWSVSNILSMIQQYFVTGWGDLGSWIPALKPASARALSSDSGTRASTASLASADNGDAGASTQGPVKIVKRRHRRK